MNWEKIKEAHRRCEFSNTDLEKFVVLLTVFSDDMIRFIDAALACSEIDGYKIDKNGNLDEDTQNCIKEFQESKREILGE